MPLTRSCAIRSMSRPPPAPPPHAGPHAGEGGARAAGGWAPPCGFSFRRRCDTGRIALHARRTTMEYAAYLREQAEKYRELAETAEERGVRRELLDLASACEQLTAAIED